MGGGGGRKRKRTPFWRGVQDGRRSDQLLEHLIALLQVGLVAVLLLLAQRLQQRGDIGVEAAALVLAEVVEVLGELVAQLGEGPLDEEGVCGSRHGCGWCVVVVCSDEGRLKGYR